MILRRFSAIRKNDQAADPQADFLLSVGRLAG